MKTLDPNQIVGFHKLRIDLSVWLLYALRDRAKGVSWRSDEGCAYSVDRDDVRRWPLPLPYDPHGDFRRELRSLARDDTDSANAGRFLLLVGDQRVMVALEESVEESVQVVELRLGESEGCEATARVLLSDLQNSQCPIFLHHDENGIVVRIESLIDDGMSFTMRLMLAAISSLLLALSLTAILIVAYIVWYYLKNGTLS